MHVNLHPETDEHLAKLVNRAVAGEAIIFQRNGEPVAQLIPYKSGTPQKPRQGGQWKGKVKIAPDFDELPDSFMEAFRAEKD